MATAERREADPAGAARVPWWVRAFVYGFLAVLVAFVVRDQEWWPLTSWHLFSHVRSDTANGYEVRSVGLDGTVRPFRFVGLPDGERLETRLLPHLGTLPAARQASTCEAWLRLAQTHHGDVAGLRVYAVRRHLPRGDGRPGSVVAERLALTCGAAP